MSASPPIRIVDTTLRDGSHAIAHQFRVGQVEAIARVLDQAGVWAIAVGHGDGLGASSIQYGRPLHSDAELLGAAAQVASRAQIAIAILPGIGTKADLERAREAGATVARVSTVCTEADIGVQHLGLARELGMIAHTHLNTAHLLDVAGLVEQSRIVADAGSQGVFIVDSAGALLTDEVRRRVAAMRAALPADVAVGIHEHNNLSLAVANSVAAIEEGATLVDASLAGLGAGAGNCQTEALVAVLERMGMTTGVDLWALQDVADDVVRGEVMQRRIEVDRLTATMGFASVPASYLLHAIRASERFHLDPRDIIVELGRRKVVVGQEDMIIGLAAEMANDPPKAGDGGKADGPARAGDSLLRSS
jgi:4-hydroxy-2-oxovalerate aldolase